MENRIVVDVNVLEEGILDRVSGHCFVIPKPVLYELDNRKKLSHRARAVLRGLEQRLLQNRENPGFKIVDAEGNADSAVVSYAKKSNIPLASLDKRVRILALHDGVDIFDFQKDEHYKGWRSVELEHEDFADLNNEKAISDSYSLCPNEYVLFADKENDNSWVYWKNSKTGMLERVKRTQTDSKIKLKTPQQDMLSHALSCPDLKYVFAIGQPGSGKTFLSIDAALYRALIVNDIDSVVVMKPFIETIELQHLGALPGDLKEKTDLHLRSVYDNISQISKMGCYDRTYGQLRLEELLQNMRQKTKLVIGILSELRGRTFTKSYVVVDEAQNCVFANFETLMSRLGDESKMIFTGDPLQKDIHDSPLMDISDAFKDADYAATVYFDDPSMIVRSPFIADALERLSGI